MVDHSTKLLELYPLRDQKSETIAKKIFDKAILTSISDKELQKKYTMIREKT